MSFVFFLLGLMPILWLIFALIVLKWPTPRAAFGSLLLSILLGMFIWKLNTIEALSATLEGCLMALWPIVLVIVAAIFTYNLTVRTGGMETIKAMMTSVTSDKRLLVLILAWCFGGFMEGMAGFGTAIAIPAGMLVALGFEPLFACLVCLIANGVPTPFGSIGIPTVTLANLLGLENTVLSSITTLQLAPFILLCPILIVMVTGGGIKGLKGVTGITLASGISFVIPQFIVGKFVGAELAVVVGSVCSLLVTILLSMKKKPDPAYQIEITGKQKLDFNTCLKAWSPFICIFVFLLLTSKLVAPINTFLAQFASQIVVYQGANPGTITFSWINTPGVWIFISALIGGLIQKASFQDFKEVFIATLKQLKPTVITMMSVLGCAKVMGYSGMIASIASFVVAITGPFYPIVAPWIGALGAFVTGSGTSSGVFFGAVQNSAAQSLGSNPYWMVALNSLGVAAGKMLSPQSIAIALSAVGGQGQDSKLLTKILPYGGLFLVLMSILAYFGNMLF
ncbi:MAG: L-lactate permease [Holdemanella sp.]|nr:L-lactate permease [Holdemanella sp.]